MPNDRLTPGDALDSLSSQDGRFVLHYQSDGNVVLYRAGGDALWATRTDGTSVGRAVMQGDGNFVVYDAAGHPVWNSQTSGHPGGSLLVQDDGNLVLYGADGAALWSSGTMVGAEPARRREPEPVRREPEPVRREPAPIPGGPDLTLPVAGGGFRETADATDVRPRLTRDAIAALLPERGAFTLPPPYGTRAVRLTNASDSGGQDAVLPCGYSYWSQINNHRGQDDLLAFVGIERRRGGQGPTLFRVSKRTHAVENLGGLFDASHPLSWAEGQGWYFSGTEPRILYLNDGPRLLRYDVLARSFETVFSLDGDRHLWQIHSSADDRVHSATVKDAQDRDLGCVVYRNGQQSFFAAQGAYDECQIDASGRWLVIKENLTRDGRGCDDNRIIDLETGAEQRLCDETGAAGHSDLGAGILVGEDDHHALPGALCRWDLRDLSSGGRLEYHLTHWVDADGQGIGLGHVSVRGDRALVSHASRAQVPRVNELVLVTLDGSRSCTVVAPNLTDLGAPGDGDRDYKNRPHANLDPLGEYAMWTSNAGGGRRDAFVVQMPATP